MPNMQTRMMLRVRALTAAAPRGRGLGRMIALVASHYRYNSSAEPVEVPVFGYRMLLDPRDLIGNTLIFTPKWYDHRERRLLRELVKPGDYVIDVGANVGTYSLFLA